MDVDALLAAQQSKYKSTEVRKEVELQYDVGNMLASDLNTLDTDSLRKRREDYLTELMRDNSQLLINKMWELPTEKVDGIVLAQLPTPTTVLPREKHIPKPKPPTKWEMFAKAKGIKHNKRSRMILDEKTQEWKPRWGYKRIHDPKDEWLVEVPDKADPYQDYFEKKAEERKEKVAKNEYQRLRNISRGQKGRIRVPLPPPNTKDLGKHQLTQAIGLAKSATASVGKFTPSLPKEPLPKRVKKRKFDPVVGSAVSEKQRNLDILSKLSKKKAVLNVSKAVNTHIATEERRIHLKRKAEAAEGKGKTKKRKTSAGQGKKPMAKGSIKGGTKGGKHGGGKGKGTGGKKFSRANN